jgi:flagellar hook protein FlgE
MDVIGNNVANVNTIGFKSGRVTFQEVFNQTLRGAGSPDASNGRGGINPMQVGLGIGVGSVDTITTRGSLQRTDNPTDMSIEGDGFFIVRGGNNDTYRFTRAGNFGVDKLGNLVSGNGMNVQGWQEYSRNSDGSFSFDTERPIEPINLYSDIYNKNKRMIAAKATTEAVFAGNLDATKAIVSPPLTSSNVQFAIPLTVYDSLGNDYKININFWKTAVGGPTGTSDWNWEVDTGGGPAVSASGIVKFDSSGQIELDPLSVTPVITLTPDATIGANEFDVKLDFSKLTMYAADSSARPTSIDGYATGNLVTFSIGTEGILTGIYSNGQQQPLGLIALASFENPAGLQKVGDNMFLPTTNSGDFKKGLRAGSEGVGTLNPGTLEMSNVDLSKEFTDMIVTERGFQANSRIITTSDEMLQELVNLKR